MDGQERGRFILVVDNKVDDRFQLTMLLQQFGYSVCTAGTADEAIEFMCVAPPVAVIADIGLAWSAFLAKFQKDGRFADIPLIILSASADRSLTDRVGKGEIAASVKKPIDVQAFYEAVQRVIEKVPRRNIRIATYLPARLEHDAGAMEGSATVLSEHGLFFRTLDPLAVRSKVRVSLEISGRTIQADAQVLYSFSFDEGPFKEPGMGMKFVKIDPPSQAFIRSYIIGLIKVKISGPGAAG